MRGRNYASIIGVGIIIGVIIGSVTGNVGMGIGVGIAIAIGISVATGRWPQGDNCGPPRDDTKRE